MAFQVLRLLATRHQKNGEPCGSCAKVVKYRLEASSGVEIVRKQKVWRMAVNFAQCFIAVKAGDQVVIFEVPGKHVREHLYYIVVVIEPDDPGWPRAMSVLPQ